MRKLYGSTSWRRVLALVLVFVMMFSIMGTSGYSVFAEGLEETGEAVVEPAAEEPAQEEEFTPQGESPGEEDAEAVEEAEEGEVEVEAVEEAEEEAEEPAEEAVEEAAEDEESEELAEAVEEEAEEGEELEAEPAEEAEEEAEEPAEEPAEEEGEEEETLVAEAAQIIVEDDGAEAPAAEVEEEAAEEELVEGEELLEELAMPEIEKEQLFEDARVYVYAPEGAFPEGTEVSIVEVLLNRTQVAAVEGALKEEIASYKAYDITFNNGEQTDMQPVGDQPVKVNIEPYDMAAAEDLQVVHMENAKKAERVYSEATDEGLAFDAAHFSVYVVVETGEDARLTVEFVQADGNKVSMMINQRQANDADMIKQYIYDPGVGTLPTGSFFDGWSDVENYTSASTPKTIENIRTEVKAELNKADGIQDGAKLTYYAMVFVSRTVTYVDERAIMVKTDQILMRTDETAAPSYEVNCAYTPYPSETVGVVAQFVGWQQITPEVTGEMVVYQNGNTIELTESAYVFKARTQEGHWLSFEENLSNASFTEPQFIALGSTPSEPAKAPDRAGYTFVGWYTKDASDARDGLVAEDAVAFDFSKELTANTTVYGKWTRDTKADYNVVFWLQNMEGTSYDFGEILTMKDAAVGQPTYTVESQGTGDARFARVYNNATATQYTDKKYTGFHLSKVDNPVNVAAEGTTTINVYFDRNMITYIFQRGGNNNETYSGLYGTAFTKWPNPGEGYVWSIGEVKFPLSITEFNPEVVKAGLTDSTITFTLSQYDWNHRLYVYKMTPDGEWAYTNEYLIATAYVDGSSGGCGGGGSYWTPTETYTGFTIDAYCYGNPDGTWTSCTNETRIEIRNNDLYLRYARDQYSISYNDGVFVDGENNPIEGAPSARTNFLEKDNIYYEADISGSTYNVTPELEGYVFLGWYDNDLCAGDEPYTFNTMPGHNVTLYAKWGRNEYAVKLHPNDSTTDPIKYTKADQADEFWPQEGEKIGNLGGERIYFDLVGWFTDEAMTHVLDFDSFVVNKTMVSKYGKLYSEDEIDPDYPATIGELNLYAKWRGKLVGAEGIQVIYDAGDGSGAPTDGNYYVDLAEAIAGAASTPNDTNYVFSHWSVQKWDNGAFTDSGVNVFPGDTFAVMVNNAQIKDSTGAAVTPAEVTTGKTYTYTVQLKAVYVEKEKETNTYINWYYNYENAPTNGLYLHQDNLKINEAVSVPAAPTRAGYTFLGWIRGIDEASTDGTTTETELFIENDENYATTEVAADEKLVGNGKQHHALYAKWEENSVTILYKVAEDCANMGTVSRAEEIVNAASGTAQGSTAAANTGFEFVKWTTEDGTTVSTSAEFVPSKTDGAYAAATYYAHFDSKKYDVTYSYSGTKPEAAEAAPEGQTNVQPGAQVTVAAVPADIPDYVFVGWDTEAEITIADGKFTMPAANVAFTGAWKDDKNNNDIPDDQEDKYNVTYSYTGEKPEAAEAAPAGQTNVLSGTQVTVAAVPADIPDYVFVGWDTEAEIKIADGKFTMPSANVAFTGEWKDDKNNNDEPDQDEVFTVVYTDGVDNEEIFPDQESEARVGDNTPSFDGKTEREGFTFNGWDPEVQDTVRVEDADEDNVITYTAQWTAKEEPPVEPVTYTIIYHSNYTSKVSTETDETVPVEEATAIVTFNAVKGANEQKFSKTSPWANGNTTYTFNSWNTKADGSGTTIQLGDYDGTGAVVQAEGSSSMASRAVRFALAMVATSSNGGTLELWAQWDESTSGGGNPYRPPVNPNPDPDPDPVVDPDEPIDDGDTPLAPGTIDDEDETIDDGDTPLAPAEVEEDTEIDEEATPLSPFTGDERHTAVWGFVSLLSLAGIVVVARKRREE